MTLLGGLIPASATVEIDRVRNTHGAAVRALPVSADPSQIELLKHLDQVDGASRNLDKLTDPRIRAFAEMLLCTELAGQMAEIWLFRREKEEIPADIAASIREGAKRDNDRAEWLLDRLAECEAERDQIRGRAIDRIRQIFVTDWQMVEAMAQKLAYEGTLTKDQIFDVFEAELGNLETTDY